MAPPRSAARWLANKENAADLVGGVNLGVKDPYLARTLLDLSQTATINDSLKLGKDVLGELGPHQHPAQGPCGAGRLCRAQGAGHSLDPGRDGLHLQSRGGKTRLNDEAYQDRMAEAILKGIRRPSAISMASILATRPCWRG
jgi:N-acetylmuramoyl-L-alanine amidase